MHGVNTGRLGLSATCIGLARWALNQAVDYAKVRKTFGKPIAEHQAVQILLADSAAEIYAAETMLLDCAMKLERGEKAMAETSMVKLHCTEGRQSRLRPLHPGAWRHGADERTAARGRLPLHALHAHSRRHERNSAPHHRARHHRQWRQLLRAT